MPDQAYEGATPEQLRHPLVQEFLGVHNYFRNQLAAMLVFIDALIAGDEQLTGAETTVRTHQLIRAGTQYTQHLHFHHHAETEQMFPALQREGLDPAIIDRLNADHDELGVMIDQFSSAIRDLSKIEPEVMNNDMRRLADALREHLAYEETHVCPLLTHWTHFPLHK